MYQTSNRLIGMYVKIYNANQNVNTGLVTLPS